MEQETVMERSKQRRIHWTPEEYAHVLDNAVRAIKTRGVVLDSEFQVGIPDHRRREGVGSTWKAEIRHVAKAAIAGATTITVHPPALEIIEPAATPPSGVTLIELGPNTIALVREVMVWLKAGGTPTAPPATGTQPPTTAAPHNPHPVQTSDATLRPRVMIVGLLGQQAQEITNRFGQSLDLRFHTSDASSTMLSGGAATADHVIGMVGFLGHPSEATLKRNSDHYTPVSGGVSMLRTVLTGIVNGGVK